MSNVHYLTRPSRSFYSTPAPYREPIVEAVVKPEPVVVTVTTAPRAYVLVLCIYWLVCVLAGLGVASLVTT